MKTINIDILNSAIENNLKYIPVCWPLQQFIATNPLWDLISQPMEDLSLSIPNVTGIRFTLPLREYFECYQNGKIKSETLHQAIGEVLTPSEGISLYQELMLGFLNKSDYQEKILTCEKLLEDHEFHPKGILFSKQIQTYGYDNALAEIQSECLNWISMYFNPTHFHAEALESLQSGVNKFILFEFWREMISKNSKAWRSFLSSQSKDIGILILELLDHLKIPEISVPQYIFEICWQLKGWVGYAKWQKVYPDNPYFNKPVEIMEIIAIWLAYEVFWSNTHRQELKNFKPNFRITSSHEHDNYFEKIWLEYLGEVEKDLSAKNIESISLLIKKHPLTLEGLHWLWQRAYEISFQEPLYQSLMNQKKYLAEESFFSSLRSQWIFCIDVRSEGFRRHLESLNFHETFGFAGFFGFAYQLDDSNTEKSTCQCPALINPNIKVKIEKFTDSIMENSKNILSNSIKEGRKSILSPFATYEIFGSWFSFVLILKNYFFGNKSKMQDFEIPPTFKIDNLDLEAMAAVGKNFLQSIGLTKDFAEFIIIAGHSARTENNPYQAAFDCGACGGNSGKTNAILACEVLNKKSVREKLAEKGILIPGSAVFIAACHNTTTDHIQWLYNPEKLTSDQKARLEIIKLDALQAGKRLEKERADSLPGDPNGIRRSRDWAELIPEWALINNCAFIIGPRKLTKSLNLERKVFLHSYESDQDPDGKLLESIFLGPVVVAHWINSQYYFSSINPKHFGSGNKAIHNVLPQVGVMEGNESDLKYGLPRQSIFFRNKRLHEPRRLYVLVDAEKEKIEAIIKKNEVLDFLVKGRWLWVESLQGF